MLLDKVTGLVRFNLLSFLLFCSDNSWDKSDLKSETSSVNLKYQEENKSNCKLGEPSHAEFISELKGLGRCILLH